MSQITKLLKILGSYLNVVGSYIVSPLYLSFFSLFREELKEKYEGKLQKELSGPTFEVMGTVMKHIINRKLTGPGNFVG